MIALSLYLSAMVCAAEHELTTDILVVGGSAGLSAAVQGAESGKKVILLEKTAWWVALPPLPKDCSRLTCSIGSK